MVSTAAKVLSDGSFCTLEVITSFKSVLNLPPLVAFLATLEAGAFSFC